MGRCLRSDAPHSLRGCARCVGDALAWKAWGATLLRRAGFRLTRVVPTVSAVSVIEGERV